jgi:NitT/TauT family transport system permease protein
LFSFVALIVVWEIAGRGGNPLLTSYPTAVLRAFAGQVASGTLSRALLESLQPLLLGYGLAVLIGVPAGLVLGRFWAIEASASISSGSTPRRSSPSCRSSFSGSVSTFW